MANDLTGDNEAVLAVSVSTINSLLATLHQNGAWSDASPMLLHRFSTRVGDPPQAASANLTKLSQWLAEADLGPVGASAAGVFDRAPAGVATQLKGAVGELERALNERVTPAVLRGKARVQVSTPTVSIRPGAVSEATARLDLRVHYTPDPGSAKMPEPIHGVLTITFGLETKVIAGEKHLEVVIPDDDAAIGFHGKPAAGLTGGEVQTIVGPMRSILRERFVPINAKIPSELDFDVFKGVSAGGKAAAALPVQLSSQAPAASVDGVDSMFLGPSSDFAVAISKEHVLAQLQPSLDALASQHPQFSVIGATYTVTFDVVAATWTTDGRIRLTIQGHANTGSILPNVGSFKIEQELQFELSPGSSTLEVVPAGQPTVAVDVNGPFGGLLEGYVEPIVASQYVHERDAALSAAQSKLQPAMQRAGQVDDAVKSLDATTSAAFHTLEPHPSGLIFHGAVKHPERAPVVAEFDELEDGVLSAFRSWIPGGTIQRFEWSWVEAGSPFELGGGTTQVTVVKPSFRFKKPSHLPPGTDACLRVVGTQDGKTGEVAGGNTCSVSGQGFILRMPSWWETIMGPIWLPDPPPDGILEDVLRGHVNVLGRGREAKSANANALVHFAGDEWASSMAVLGDALERVRHAETPLTLVLVLPQAAFRQRVAEVESSLRPLGKRFAGQVTVTADFEGGWSRTFAVDRGPASFLINVHGEQVWDARGTPERAELAATLKRHLVAGPPPRPQPLRLNVRPGDRAFGASLRLIDGGSLPLRKLRGKTVLLNFWLSWSRPCLKELERLQELHARGAEGGLVIVAVNGGEERDRIVAVQRELGLSFALALDADQGIARGYGVDVWPTTITVGPNQRVGNIQLGVHHHHAPTGSAQSS